MNELKKDGLPLLLWDLQFFAEEEKTEEATPRKKREARKKGQVPKSMEFNSVLVVLVAFVVMNIWRYFIRNLHRFLLESFRPETNTIVDEVPLSISWQRFILTAFLPGAAVAAAGVAINLCRPGVFTAETLKVRWDRINPVQGFEASFPPGLWWNWQKPSSNWA